MVRKSICTLGALGALASTAHAQSNVTIYGLLDEGIVHESGGKAGTVTGIASGMSAGSRLGFMGKEYLGGGLSANFLLETGFQMDTGTLGQGGLLFGRQGYMGLKGDFGAINAGIQYTPYYLVVSFADPFISGLAGKGTGMMASSGTRMDNTVKYNSPSFCGAAVEIAYQFGEVAGDTRSNSAFGGALSYSLGSLELRLAHHNKRVVIPASSTAPAGSSDAKNTMIAATYNFKIFKLYGAYAVNKGFGSSPFLVPTAYSNVAPAASTNSRDMLLGISIPYGQHTFLASIIRKDDKDVANRDATKWAIGYFYALSKHTKLYASYSAINNTNGAAYTVATAIESGTGNKGSNIGIVHSF